MSTGSTRRMCTRCGWRDRRGHGCTRSWFIPRTFWGVSRSGWSTGNGKIRSAYWELHWKWRGDVHKLLPHFSLGEHINVSARSRAEQREREEFEREYAGA